MRNARCSKQSVAQGALFAAASAIRSLACSFGHGPQSEMNRYGAADVFRVTFDPYWRTFVVLPLFALFLAGCSGDDKSSQASQHVNADSDHSSAASQPAQTNATEAPAGAKSPLMPESPNWTREQAVAHLDDDAAAISAAVRLVELSDVETPLKGGEWSAERVNALRIAPLGEDGYVFGSVDKANENLLSGAMRINPDGQVTLVVVEEMPGARVYASPDHDLFPSLLIGKHEVRMLSDLESEAMKVESPESAEFDMHVEDDIATLVLVVPADGATAEAARYHWDPYELTFIGPAVDKLPDPPGGKFTLDLKRCGALTPMGGELPPPPVIDNNNPQGDPEKEGPIY